MHEIVFFLLRNSACGNALAFVPVELTDTFICDPCSNPSCLHSSFGSNDVVVLSMEVHVPSCSISTIPDPGLVVLTRRASPSSNRGNKHINVISDYCDKENTTFLFCSTHVNLSLSFNKKALTCFGSKVIYMSDSSTHDQAVLLP